MKSHRSFTEALLFEPFSSKRSFEGISNVSPEFVESRTVDNLASATLIDERIEDCNIMILGENGAGKSTLAEILARGHFIQGQHSLEHVTKKLELVQCPLKNNRRYLSVKIMDTKGYVGDERVDEGVLMEMLRQASKEVSKIHAIFVCLTAKRNGVTKTRVISMLQAVLSDEAKRRLYILVSHCPEAAEMTIRPQLLQKLDGFGYDIEDHIIATI